MCKKAKMSGFKLIHINNLIFECESWALTRRLKSKIQSLELRYLTRILGIARKYRIKNHVIRQRLEAQPFTQPY